MAQNTADSELPSSSPLQIASLEQYRGLLNLEDEDEDDNDGGFLRSLDIHHDFADGDPDEERQQAARLVQSYQGSRRLQDLQNVLSEQGLWLTKILSI